MVKYKIITVIIFIGLILFLHQVFSGAIILSQTFSVGPLTIHYYGIFMALAVLAGFILAEKRAGKFGVSKTQAENIIFWLVVGGFIGARLYHVASDFSYYSQNPIQTLEVWKGGLSIYGALIGGLITLFVLRKSLNLKPAYRQAGLSILNLADWLAPSLALGQVIGRFGNFFNYEVLGYPTNLPWKMFVPVQFRPEEFISSNFFHPFFLYEAIFSAVVLFVLLKIKKPRTAGKLFFLYLLLYNSGRFFLEFIRTDSTYIHGLRLNAIVSLVLVVIAAAALFGIKNYDKVP